MSRRPRTRPTRRDDPPKAPDLPPPVDVVDGIPDRRPTTPRWRYAVIAAVFLAWLGFLVYCAAAGNP
jgi:hypothetical protein